MSKRHEYVFMGYADLVRICNMSSNIVEDVRKRQPHEVIVLLVLGGICYLTTKVGMTRGRSEEAYVRSRQKVKDLKRALDDICQ